MGIQQSETDLIRQGASVKLPEIAGEKCVHALSVLASCSICVDVCPVSALIMYDGFLGLDEEVCNGCGLCQGECPQNTIFVEPEPPVLGNEAMLVCDKVLPADPRRGLQNTCIHTMGLEQLAQIYLKGVRTLFIITTECAGCENGARDLFKENVATFNRLSRSRGLAPLKLVETEPEIDPKWFLQSADNVLDNAERRALFASFLEPMLRSGESSEKPASKSSLALFQEKGGKSAAPLFLFTPTIDEEKCEGCDACVNICPQQSLTLVKDENSIRCYEIEAATCNGCGLCVDVCQVGAMALEPMHASTASKVSLQNFICKSCGAPYHLPGAKTFESNLCRICSQTDHHKKLFQVLT